MTEKISTGQVLLAEPFMLDPNFRAGVVLLVDHTETDGSVGFVLNKKLDWQINDLVYEFPAFEAPVYYGGPVQQDTLHYLHNVGSILDGSTPIVDGIWWGGDFEKLKFLIETELIQPKNIRFFSGYSGWSPGQLEEEMQRGSWVISEMFANYLFKSKPTELWRQIMRNKGDRFEVIADMSEEVNLN